ncbi:hypothetical protein EJ06DRAFT_91734 [Trichodelitschia bisporula]|uniref:Nuclear pore complex subunit Nup192 n=1 Tax=Trichodelitschia bisporula TaxID=703511 RepID=A0A6G1HSB9_9PEZI|nr:hypothetical protein EJ06DRAFT_91734 [Trichodelitschia bisporula]
MADSSSFESLEGLHRDLLSFRDNHLPDIERLVNELAIRIDEFRSLLDQKPKSNQSRQNVSEGNIELDDVKYSVNDEFKQGVFHVADELELDELETTKLLLLAQDDARDLDRSPVASAIIRFHKRRGLLLECLRLALKIAIDNEAEDSVVASAFTEFKRQVLQPEELANSKFWQKCLNAMTGIEAWLQRLSDRSQRASMVGQSFSAEAMEIIDFENKMLTTQHESLAAIATYLVQDGCAVPEDFRNLLVKMRTLDRVDMVVLHYLPMLIASISRFGTADGPCPDEDAQSLNQLILAEKESEHWNLRSFHAAVYIFWTSEYASRSLLALPAAGDQRENPDAETDLARFDTALQDGGFHFILSTVQYIKRSDWYDPTLNGILETLLEDAQPFSSDIAPPTEHFKELATEQLRIFVEAFISNTPNTLRHLKYEEDNQRRELRSRFQRHQTEFQYHLERFLLILAFAFEDSPEEAKAFWDDPEGNLYGFLSWAAKRQTTPRAAAFCEMLRSLSQGDECADSAHQFLLEEGPSIGGKLKRTGSLSWNQIYAELEFYASSIKNRPAPTHTGQFNGNNAPMDQVVEPESSVMLVSYLRLVTHLCRESSKARTWVLANEAPSLSGILLQLSASNIESRLRACAFATLASLLTDKTPKVGEPMWSALDEWICTGSTPATHPARPHPQGSPAWSEQMIFDTIASSFDEANAFVTLLNNLVAPYQVEDVLNDVLPFPESLGAQYRASGIDSYVDFVLGKVFGDKSLKLVDVVQQRLLRLSCLDFIATCLSTFNEDLVVIANKSNFPVEAAMKASSLENYARLHPFARVMEWLFNERVLTALFATLHQEATEVNEAAPGSPFILSLVRSVDVMNLMLRLQTTYFNIVRPLLRSSSGRGSSVAHSSISTFEDAILNNLAIVVDLGLYCGTGHQDLTICSLALLERLSSSRKLVVSPSAGFGKYSDRSKLIGVLEKDGEAERIARALILELQIDPREIEGGVASPGYIIKTSILSFLRNCLAALPDRPTIAHMLLGFNSRTSQLDISPEGLFAEGASLFHALVRLAIEYPDTDIIPTADNPGGEVSFFAWLSCINDGATDVLQQLWRSSLSSDLAMTELRVMDYVFLRAVNQVIVNQHTLWDGRVLGSDNFFFTDSAVALRNFLRQRASFYDFAARELRVTVKEGMSSLRARLQAALLGSTSFPGEQQIRNPTLFDLFDFMDLEIGGAIQLPKFTLLNDLNFDVCLKDPNSKVPAYDLSRAEEMILLRKHELEKADRLKEGTSEATVFGQEANTVLLCLLGKNHHSELMAAHGEALQAWRCLIVTAADGFDLDDVTKSTFALQIIQLVLPKIERAFSDDPDTVVMLARLIQPLLKYIDPVPSGGQAAADLSNDRLFQVFRTFLDGSFSTIATAEIRELCYQISYQSLNVCAKVVNERNQLGRHTLRTVKLAGDRLIDTLCDDAYSGQGACRVAALLLLDALVSVANQMNSKLLIERFAHLNFTGLLVDSIKFMPAELGSAPASEIPAILSYYNANLALLLRLSQTRLGANQVLNTGLFRSVRDSQLFSADPDIGLEIENPDALKKFFDLMLSIIRVINAVVLSRGHSNDRTLKLAREFLTENRQSVVGVFKRHASIGGKSHVAYDLGDLVDNFTLLISATGFLEFEDTSSAHRSPLSVFS